jgi:hypothetical protein
MTMDAMPTPPILVIRPGIAFWVETAPAAAWTATAQALAEGCFDGALCCDGGGGAWEVLSATAEASPPALPWQRMAVAIRLGPRREMTEAELRALLLGALDGAGAFADSLDASAARDAVARASGIPGLIAAAASVG